MKEAMTMFYLRSTDSEQSGHSSSICREFFCVSALPQGQEDCCSMVPHSVLIGCYQHQTMLHTLVLTTSLAIGVSVYSLAHTFIKRVTPCVSADI
jgi:hypothetical protein